MSAEATDQQQKILERLYDVIQERKHHPSPDSYVASLFARGLDKILAKIGEEATETAVAGKGGGKGGDRP